MYMDASSLYTAETLAQAPAGRVVDVRVARHDPSAQAKKRVAAYCRVSTDSAEQLNSLENQMSAFRNLIALHADWELVNLYTDEGVTGTSARRREGFQRMIADCEAGKIDAIITKSISRFARNTTDCLSYVRRLQAMGVELYFEKEGINTADSCSEMLLTVMAAFAQEESRSISENVKWGLRKRFEAGCEMRVPVYGYRHTGEAMYQIVPGEAAIVREIFARYVRGETPSQIMRDMIARNVPPPAGDRWKLLQLSRMLHNEKYTGDVVLQKHYVESHLTHREVKNRGEIPLYHVYNAHPAIIDRKTFARAEAVSRMRQVKTGNSSYPYGGLLHCPLCGGTLVHGCLNSMYFGGQRVRRGGGWGCYGRNGCGRYLLIQSLLDGALLAAHREAQGTERQRVDYEWLDELVERIELGRGAWITVHWRDGRKQVAALPIVHEEQRPENAAARYQRYLERLRSGAVRQKNRFIMGL